jgi:hypothetical protein
MISHEQGNQMNRTDGHYRVTLPLNRIWRSNSSLMAVGLAAIVAASGCSKKTSSVTPAPPPVADAQADAAPGQPASPQPAQPSASPLVQADGQPDLSELNRKLIRWIVGNRRPPKNFEDFAATAGFAIPAPPPGKKYVIAKNMHIELVSQ